MRPELGDLDATPRTTRHRPDPEQVAALLFGVVAGERGEIMPTTVSVGIVCSADRNHLFVHLSGLSDQFILGPSTHLRNFPFLDPDAAFTSEARQLRFRVLDLARATLPRKPSGELWFATDVWLMTEPFWRSAQFGFHGVAILGKGDSQ